MTSFEQPPAEKIPRVAILCPYHNRAGVVARTFNSIAEQTFADFEALIWDDCSTDETWAEMQRVATSLNDPRFNIYRHEANLGLTPGLNLALRRTRAKYIAIVGSGDECHPERIERQVAALERAPDAVFCATASTTTDPITKTTFYDSAHHRETIVFNDIRTHCPFTHGSVMYRASALNAVGLYETAFKWCADWDMFFRLLRTGQAVYLDEVLYLRTAQADGVSFAPRKAFDQINCKYLAIKLSGLDESGRAEVLASVREQGMEFVLEAEKPEIWRDLARRNVKLYLMGRQKAGDEMMALIDGKGVTYPTKYRLFIAVAKLLGKLPVSADFMIRAARALPR
ncbi:glycosyltransferase family 2 protein [Pelagibacterium nitratireducens]|uniref:Glycosyltransferase family 2 protein n=1 Tax=Pelagibacterium nitratireducens TaxID=1046114 RepID=A0ABZ2I289_9HYPH